MQTVIYELMYLVPESHTSKLTTIKADVRALVEKAGGLWQEPAVELHRKMAYKIKHERKGIYVTQRFSVQKPDLFIDDVAKTRINPIDIITRDLNLYAAIYRFIIVRADELPSLEAWEQKVTSVGKNVPHIEPVQAINRRDKVATVEEDDIDKKLEEVLNL